MIHLVVDRVGVQMNSVLGGYGKRDGSRLFLGVLLWEGRGVECLQIYTQTPLQFDISWFVRYPMPFQNHSTGASEL